MEQFFQLAFNHSETFARGQSFNRGDHLFLNAPSELGIYFIGRGTIKIYSMESNGKHVIHRLAKRGDLIGQSYLFGEKVQKDHAQAIDSGLCHFLSEKEFESLLIQNPEISIQILKKLGQSLACSENRYQSFIKKNVRERLASHFHYMSQHFGETKDQERRIYLQLTREEIASIVGTANETIIRFISEFKDLGLIKEEDRCFHILDSEKLAVIGRVV